jgi:hypothetical protein
MIVARWGTAVYALRMSARSEARIRFVAGAIRSLTGSCRLEVEAVALANDSGYGLIDDVRSCDLTRPSA